MAVIVQVYLESEEEKAKLEVEATSLGVSNSTLLRLLFKNWIGEVKLERKDDGAVNQEKKG
jgi:hypothetical protein